MTGSITAVLGAEALGLDRGPVAAGVSNSAWGLATGPDGSLYIADYANHRIRKVAADGQVSTRAGRPPASPTAWTTTPPTPPERG
jgi:serine/threonine-protein kinase